MAEQQAVGHPGGPSGPRNATAATFQVDDSSLRALRVTVQGLVTDLKNVNAELVKMGSLGAKAFGAAGIGGGSGGHAAIGGGTISASTISPVGSASSELSRGTFSTPPGGGGGGDDHSSGPASSGGLSRGSFSWKKTAGYGAVGSVYAAGSYINRNLSDISDANLLFNQQAQQMGGPGYNGHLVAQNRRFLFGGAGQSGIGGYSSSQDLLSGVGGVMGVTGGNLGQADLQRVLRSTGALASLNPSAGLTGAGNAVGGLYGPQMTQRLMSLGITPGVGSRGVLNDPQAVYRSFLTRVYGGRMPTKNEIAAGGRQGSRLMTDLQRNGFSGDQIQSVLAYGTASANLGGNASQVNLALTQASQGHNTALVKQAGLLDSIRSRQNQLGRAQANQQQTLGGDATSALEKGFGALAGMTEELTGAFNRLNKGIGGVGAGAAGGFLGASGFLANPLQHALGAVGGVFGASFAVDKLKSWGVGKSGIAGKALRGAGIAGDVLNKSNSTPVFVVNWPGGGFGGGGGGLPSVGNATKDVEEAEKVGKGGRFLSKLGSVARWAKPAALPLALGITADVIVGHDINMLTHGGAFSALGAKSDNAINNINIQGQDAQSLTNYEIKLRQKGVIGPGAPGQGDFDSKAKPLIHRYLQSKNANDWQAAFNALTAIEHKYAAAAKFANSANLNTQHMDSLYTGKPYGGPTGSGSGIIQPNYGHGAETINTIEQMAKPEMSGMFVTSTVRPGGQSYHATGNAVDFAPPGGVHDVPALMNFNHWWAKKYGKQLAELIYTGPGGITIKDGKVIPPAQWNSFWGADTVSQHHNHVHVAATTKSLGMGSGGVPIDSSTSSGAASSGVTSTSSSGMPSGAMSVSANPSIEEVSALAAALSGGGGGMASLSSAPGGVATVGKKATASGAAPTSMPKGNVAGWIKSAMGIMKLPYAKYASAIATIIQHESSGNPNSVNTWDSNAKAGHPSKGLMQTIDSTFNAHALPGHQHIFNPVDNIIAATRYAMARYGSLDNVPGIKSLNSGGPYIGYKEGTWQTSEGAAYLHNDEMVLPAATARKVRSQLQQASSGMSGGGGGGGVTVYLTAPITITGKATMQDAHDHVRNIRRALAEDDMLNSMASG